MTLTERLARLALLPTVVLFITALLQAVEAVAG